MELFHFYLESYIFPLESTRNQQKWYYLPNIISWNVAFWSQFMEILRNLLSNDDITYIWSCAGEIKLLMWNFNISPERLHFC